VTHIQMPAVDNRVLRQMIRRLMNEGIFESIAKNRVLWLSPIAAVFYCRSEPIN